MYASGIVDSHLTDYNLKTAYKQRTVVVVVIIIVIIIIILYPQ